MKKNSYSHETAPPTKAPVPPVVVKPPQYSSHNYRPPQPNYRPPAGSVPIINPLQQELKQHLNPAPNGYHDTETVDHSDEEQLFDNMVDRNLGNHEDDSLDVGDTYQGDGDSDSDQTSVEHTPVLGLHHMLRGQRHTDGHNESHLSESDSRYVKCGVVCCGEAWVAIERDIHIYHMSDVVLCVNM